MRESLEHSYKQRRQVLPNSPASQMVERVLEQLATSGQPWSQALLFCKLSERGMLQKLCALRLPRRLRSCAQVVERVLERLAADANNDPACPVLGVVRLSGLVHAEERAAFREVARQLCLCAPGPLFYKGAVNP